MSRSLLVISAVLVVNALPGLAQERARLNPSTVRAATPDEGARRALLDRIGVRPLPEPVTAGTSLWFENLWAERWGWDPVAIVLKWGAYPGDPVFDIRSHLSFHWQTEAVGAEKLMWQVLRTAEPWGEDIAPEGLVRWDFVPIPRPGASNGSFSLSFDWLSDQVMFYADLYYIRIVPFSDDWKPVGIPSNPLPIVLVK